LKILEKYFIELIFLVHLFENYYFVLLKIKHFLFNRIPAAITHNVPAVCDGFVVAIKERGAFQQPQNCGGAKHHKGRKPDWCFAEPEPL